MIRGRWFVVTALACFFSLSVVAAPESEDLATLQSGLIPKREVGADVFIADNPSYDGRGVVIAVFDTGVDPAAAGLAVTTTGARKVVDIIDGSGSGDVDTSAVAQRAADGTLIGLSGRVLTLPDGVSNPSGDFHLGLKRAAELFSGSVFGRLQSRIEASWEAELSLVRAAREREDSEELAAARKKAAADRTRAESDQVARAELREALEDGLLGSGPGPIFDCVVWHDGTHWRVLIDTDFDGDMADETLLRPYGVAGEYGTFDEETHATFGVQVYEGGDLLSIVTVSGTHGTHVASIASAHFPDNPIRNGVAPGAQILSIKIGDIRTRGSSYGLSERRALAAAAQHGVDIMNASWGGSSLFQDGKDANSTLYTRMVERYGILAVMSAGNEGPGLSTAGSAGGEASRVLGVGAYASADMARVLYNAVDRSPDAALQFTSRGPTKDGDLGVDVMAPGAAWAAYSAESLRGAEMINGTSMAAPNASGVAALVMSAAKQNGVKASAVLMRQALMLGASALPAEDNFTQGQGMVNAPGAWAKLQALQNEPAFSAYYDLEIEGGSFAAEGRGLYLREDLTEPRRRVAVAVTPAWGDDVDSEARYGFETDLILTAADDWVQVPDYLHVANGTRRFSMFLDIPPVDAASAQNGGVLMSRVDARVAEKPELGVVFSIPITIVRPAVDAFVNNELKTKVELSPAETARRFYEVPAGVERLQMQATHRAADPVARRFFVQAITIAAESAQNTYKEEVVEWVEEGDAFEMNIPVKAGHVVELAFNQYFYSAGDVTLELDLKWVGVGAPRAAVVMEPNQAWLPLELNPGSDLTASVSPKLEHAVSVYLPTQASEFFDDERGELPASPRHPGPQREAQVRLVYELNFKEATEAVLLNMQDYDASDGIGGGRTTLVHESGEVLYDGFPDAEQSIEFPEGKTTVIADFAAFDAAALQSVKTFPLRVARPLDSPKSLGVAPDMRARFAGRTSKSVDLRAGRESIVMLKDTAVDDLAKVEPAPDYFVGTIAFSDADDHPVIELPLRYFLGQSPAKVTNQDPKAKPAKDLKTAVEKLDDGLTDAQLAFLRDERFNDDAAVQARRAEVLQHLLTTRPEDPRALVEQAIDGAVAGGFASEIWGKSSADEDDTEAAAEGEAEAAPATATPAPDLATVRGWLDEAAALAAPNAVSAFFGAKPVAAPGDLEKRDEIAAREKELSGDRDTLATIELLRADLARAEDDLDGAWAHWAERGRWEDKPSDRATELEALLYRAGGQLGLYLETLNARIDEAPYDRDLLEERIELYRELGWERLALEQECLLAWRKAKQAYLKQLN